MQGEGAGTGYRGAATENLGGDGNVLSPDCGGGQDTFPKTQRKACHKELIWMSIINR